MQSHAALALLLVLVPTCQQRAIPPAQAQRIVRRAALAENARLFGGDTPLVSRVARAAPYYHVALALRRPPLRLPRFRCAVDAASGQPRRCEALQPFGEGHCVKRQRYIDGAPRGWAAVDCAGHFRFRLPPQLKLQLAMGIDSAVATFASPTMRLSIDHGWYSNDFARARGAPGYRESHPLVDGRRAKVVHFRQDGARAGFPGLDHVAGIHFDSVERSKASTPMKLTLYIYFARARQRGVAARILDSVRCPR